MKVKKIILRDGMLSKEYVQLLGLESEWKRKRSQRVTRETW